MIDYRQRLATNLRSTFTTDGAKYLVNEALASGRKAMGVDGSDNFTIGQPLDAVVIDSKSPLIMTSSLKNLLSTIVYTGDASCNLGTLVNGNWIVKQQEHPNHSLIRQNFLSAIRNLGSR